METSTALTPFAKNTLAAHSSALANPWAHVPSLGDINAYIRAVNRLPMLTLEEEQRYARELREEGSMDAASRLVLSHLRLVVAVTRKYLGYGLPHADLIQEGNIGLMRAVRHFDAGQGVRLVTYALRAIKSSIHDYILKNWRIVKFASGSAQRKLFFSLRSSKGQLAAEQAEGSVSEHLSESQRASMAIHYGVSAREVMDMENRLAAQDVPLDVSPDTEEDGLPSPAAWLSDPSQEPSQILALRQREHLATQGLQKALEVLDDRSRRIVQERWLHSGDDGDQSMTLQALADEYGISAERVRQIEVAALKKLRKAIEPAIA